MPAHDKRAGGTNESDGAYRTSEFSREVRPRMGAGGDLFAARGRGSDVCAELPLGREGRFQELSEAFAPVANALHHTALHKHARRKRSELRWCSSGGDLHTEVHNIMHYGPRSRLIYCNCCTCC